MRRIPILALLSLALASAACGSTDDAAHGGHSATAVGGDATRAVEIEMQDNKYVPDSVEVADGETVRFVFTNNGSVPHDAFIGDEAAQDDHEMEMNSDMGGHNMGETDAITVEPGDTGELTHTFAAGGDEIIGCHEPGHYDGGMRVTIT
jgi:uncharacterized cupredoxin-like copper-binding protein